MHHRYQPEKRVGTDGDQNRSYNTQYPAITSTPKTRPHPRHPSPRQHGNDSPPPAGPPPPGPTPPHPTDRQAEPNKSVGGGGAARGGVEVGGGGGRVRGAPPPPGSCLPRRAAIHPTMGSASKDAHSAGPINIARPNTRSAQRKPTIKQPHRKPAPSDPRTGPPQPNDALSQTEHTNNNTVPPRPSHLASTPPLRPLIKPQGSRPPIPQG
ncbi:hypothetical protein CesoFtcFv8_005548 [Champsocephalus esox]|uniref:Uncharacterized protein n=1 Tax=Champsocephalus esox TaxID=159716 RepID=A0AAN8H9U4_9TELE|nr:hypothetical protein CesoFtcFv8_005548 [Champsocephalus esox]